MDVIFARYYLFLMVFARMTGMFLTNQLLGKRNIPVYMKMGLSLLLAVIVTPTLTDVSIQFRGLFDFLFVIAKELLVGFVISFIMQMFLSFFLMAGEMVDMQLGVGMSKIYDPQSNVSMPLTGTIFNLLFVLLFFSQNGHLLLIKMLVLSFDILPVGPNLLNFQFGAAVVQIFSSILLLALKLALPLLAVELLTEAGMGVLMKTVPQINVFVVGLQIKLIVGLIVIVLLLPGITTMMDSTMNGMYEAMKQVLTQMKLP